MISYMMVEDLERYLIDVYTATGGFGGWSLLGLSSDLTNGVHETSFGTSVIENSSEDYWLARKTTDRTLMCCANLCNRNRSYLRELVCTFSLAGLRTVSRRSHSTLVPLSFNEQDSQIMADNLYTINADTEIFLGTSPRNIFSPQPMFRPGKSCRQCYSVSSKE